MSDDPQFDYLLEDADVEAPPARYQGSMAWSETDVNYGLRPQDEPVATGHFDAFNAETWNFKPPPVPWHETPQARIAMIAVALAVIALVVSIVLLAIDGSSGDDEAPGPQTSTTPTTTATTPSPTEVLPPPPPPPPPPPESTAPAPQAPVYQRPRQPSQSKKPEIGVTRTPVTRSPISVAPQRPSNRN